MFNELCIKWKIIFKVDNLSFMQSDAFLIWTSINTLYAENSTESSKFLLSTIILVIVDTTQWILSVELPSFEITEFQTCWFLELSSER